MSSSGSLVCLVSPAGEVLVAKPRGKSGWTSSWELKPLQLQTQAQGEDPLESLPVEALFVLLRRGDQLGFKAIGADGRTLQAVEALNEAHRIYNHNFGSWESWEEMGGDLVNSHWRHKVHVRTNPTLTQEWERCMQKLGYKVRPVMAVTADALGRLGMQHKRDIMRLHKQLDKLGGPSMFSRDDQGSAASWEAREVESLKRQLEECSRSLHHWQQEAAARQAALEEVQQAQQAGQLQATRGGMGLPSQAAATIAGLRADLREAQALHAAQLGDLQAQHAQQLECLRQEHADMLKGVLHSQQQPQQQQQAEAARLPSRAKDGTGACGPSAVAALQQQVEFLQRRLQMAAAELDAAVGEARAEMQAALHAKDEEFHRMLMAKDSEIYWLLEERQRLDLALHTIKDMTALVRQASPGSAALGPAEQQRRQRRQQEGEGEAGCPLGDLHSPTLLSSLPSITVLGVPVRSRSNSAAASGEGLSGAVSIGAGRPSPELSAQSPGVQSSAGVAGPCGAAPDALEGAGAWQQGSCGRGEQVARGAGDSAAAAASSSREQEGDGTSAALALDAMASGSMLGASSPPYSHSSELPTLASPSLHHRLLQPSDVQGGVDLGAALAGPRAPVGARPSSAQQAPAPSMHPHPFATAALGVPVAPPASGPGHVSTAAGGSSAETRPLSAPPALQQAAGMSRLSREGGAAGAAAVQQQSQPAAGTAGLAAIRTSGRGGRQSPVAGHAVFNSDLRNRIATLYDMLNPFDPGHSASDTPKSVGSEDLIRVARLHRPSARFASPVQQEGAAGYEAEQHEGLSDGGSAHRVPIGGSYLVDYNGPRPDSMTEAAMARILDAPAGAEYEQRGEEVLRWRETHQAQEAGWMGASPAQPDAAPHHQPNSAPASVAGSDASPARDPTGWASGSLSLPGSTRITPLITESDRVWEGGDGTLEDLPKQHVAARRNRGIADFFPEIRPTQAVKAMQERSPGGAAAMAHLMSDRLTMRASMPEAGWLAGAKKGGPPARRLDLPPGLPEESPPQRSPPNALRRSAPAGPAPQSPTFANGPGGKEKNSRRNPLRRSSFLDRPPVQMDALWGN